MIVAHPSARALPGNVSLVSIGPNGEQGTEEAEAREPSVSADGTRVAFEWGLTGLHPEDSDVADYVYVKDLATGELSLVVKANWVDDPELSRDGTRVTFSSADPNVFPANPATTADVYVRDLSSGAIFLASTSATGERADNGAGQPSLSADGTKVAFASPATNLHPEDTDSLVDVYLKDLVTGAVMLVSTSTEGTKGNDNSRLEDFSPRPAVSADGTTVVFVSEATNLDPADESSDLDVYVKNLLTGTLTLASTTTEGANIEGFSWQPSISATGSKVAFAFFPSDPSDVDPGAGVYVKDLAAGTLTKISPSGGSPALSADGNRVAFASDSELDPSVDLPGEGLHYPLVYVTDVADQLTAAVSTNAAGLIAYTSSGSPSITDDGKKVVFASFAWNLDPIDQVGEVDVFVKQLPSRFPRHTTRPGMRQGNEWILNYGFKYYPDVRFKFAKASDEPVVGDWDGDGTWTAGAVRGNLWYLTNQTPPQTISHTFAFAKASDRLVVGDWDGDGKMTPGVVRGNTWFLSNQLPPSSISATFAFAKATDRPIVGDWDGDGIWTPGAVRGSTWFLTNQLPPSSISAMFEFGKASDVPIPGDWNGDGTFTPGVYRAGTWPQRPEWLLATVVGRPVDLRFSIYKSHPSDDPLAGDWNGGGL